MTQPDFMKDFDPRDEVLRDPGTNLHILCDEHGYYSLREANEDKITDLVYEVDNQMWTLGDLGNFHVPFATRLGFVFGMCVEAFKRGESSGFFKGDRNGFERGYNEGYDDGVSHVEKEFDIGQFAEDQDPDPEEEHIYVVIGSEDMCGSCGKDLEDPIHLPGLLLR